MASDDKNKTPKTEQQQLEDGYRREKKKQERLFLSQHGAAQNLIEMAVDATTTVIDELFAVRGAGRKEWWNDLYRLEPAQVAAIGVQTLFDAVGNHWSYNHTVIQLGRNLEAHIFMVRLRASMISQDPRYGEANFKALENRSKQVKSDREQRYSYMTWIAEQKGYITGVQDWTERHCAICGTPIFNAVLQATEMFDYDLSLRDEHNPQSGIRNMKFTAEFEQILEDRYDQLDWRSPDFSPMLTPPNRWGESLGPYNLVSLAVRVPLVRNIRPDQTALIQRAISDGAMKPVFDALNYLQEVPYQINEKVLEALKWVAGSQERSDALSDFPALHPVKVKSWPDEDEVKDWSPKKVHAFGRSRERLVKRNKSIPSNMAVLQGDIAEAEGLIGYDFYLPHNLDTRSRVYHVPKFGHHRADHVRALFLFSEAAEIDDDTIAFLKLQVANTWGESVSDTDNRKVDKLPFDERLQWVVDNQEILLKVGKDFADDEAFAHWSKADTPFQHLAACHELYCALEHGKGYKCRLPIAFDGTNSGLQHVSASCLNAKDGGKVNLTPSAIPQDVYAIVADRVLGKVRHDKDNHPDPEVRRYARLWDAYGVNRSVVKRNVMTVPYSSKPYGMSDQIVEDLMDKLSEVAAIDGTPHPFEDDATAKRCAYYLAQHNYDAVFEEIECALPSMQFLQNLEKIMRRQGLHMEWPTAIGFPAAQNYVHTRGIRVELPLWDTEMWIKRSRWDNGKPNRLSYLEDTARINATESNDGIAPNHTHSLDATHLLMAVLKSQEYGVKNLMVVHDSFATDVASAYTMNQCLRATFVELYIDRNVYELLLEHCKSRVENPDAIEWPELPPRLGSDHQHFLDMMLVMKSEYAFS
jgi:DNA-directed RNA polymerase